MNKAKVLMICAFMSALLAACTLEGGIEAVRGKAGLGLVPGTTLAQKLDWINGNAVSETLYLVFVDVDESLAPRTLSYPGKRNVTIKLEGNGSRTVTLSERGSLFTVERGVALILDNNLTLQGRSDNSTSLVRVNFGGSLEMKSGAKIIGNSAIRGGGVYVNDGGTFTMSGGEISGNASGGVYLLDGTFSKTGGIITGYDWINGNGAQSYEDYAVYVEYMGLSGRLAPRYRRNTAWPDVNLFWDYNDDWPIWSGEWDYY
jgi:hypothetical protein